MHLSRVVSDHTMIFSGNFCFAKGFSLHVLQHAMLHRRAYFLDYSDRLTSKNFRSKMTQNCVRAFVQLVYTEGLNFIICFEYVSVAAYVSIVLHHVWNV